MFSLSLTCSLHPAVVPGPHGFISAPETLPPSALWVFFHTARQALLMLQLLLRSVSFPSAVHGRHASSATLGTVKEVSSTALAPGSLKKFTSQRPDPSWDLPGAGQGWQKNCNVYFFQTSTPCYCIHRCNVALTSHAKLMSERLFSAFLPFPAPDCSAYELAGAGVVSHHFLAQSLAQRDSDLRRSKPCCINS